MKDIIELAREAGIKQAVENPSLLMVHELTRFAALVRAQVLEEAARMCKKVSSDSGGEQYDWLGKDLAQQCAALVRSAALEEAAKVCEDRPTGTAYNNGKACAAAIRALKGETKSGA